MEANAAVTQRQNSEVACVFMRCSSVDTGVAASLGFEPRKRRCSRGLTVSGVAT